MQESAAQPDIEQGLQQDILSLEWLLQQDVGTERRGEGFVVYFCNLEQDTCPFTVSFRGEHRLIGVWCDDEYNLEDILLEQILQGKRTESLQMIGGRMRGDRWKDDQYPLLTTFHRVSLDRPELLLELPRFALNQCDIVNMSVFEQKLDSYQGSIDLQQDAYPPLEIVEQGSARLETFSCSILNTKHLDILEVPRCRLLCLRTQSVSIFMRMCRLIQAAETACLELQPNLTPGSNTNGVWMLMDSGSAVNGSHTVDRGSLKQILQVIPNNCIELRLKNVVLLDALQWKDECRIQHLDLHLELVSKFALRHLLDSSSTLSHLQSISLDIDKEIRGRNLTMLLVEWIHQTSLVVYVCGKAFSAQDLYEIRKQWPSYKLK